MPDFAKALALVLKYEGGRSDDPRDPGGRTCQGVTQTTFDAWCSTNSAAKRDVFGITSAEVEAVYHDRYASAIHFDELPDGVGFCVFDAAVNSGPHKAAEWLQRAVNVPVDGIVGSTTVAAAQKQGAFATINAVCDERLAFLQRLSTWARFGHGWGTRVDDVRKNATALAHATSTGTAAPQSVLAPAATDVRWLQETLSDLGYYRGPVDADFGPYTETAVKGFQFAHRLVVDGVVGDATMAALDAAMVVRAAATPPMPSPGPIPGLGRIPEPPSLLPPGFIAPKAPPAPYTPPAVPGPHIGTTAAPKQSWAQWWAGLFGKAS